MYMPHMEKEGKNDAVNFCQEVKTSLDILHAHAENKSGDKQMKNSLNQEGRYRDCKETRLDTVSKHLCSCATYAFMNNE